MSLTESSLANHFLSVSLASKRCISFPARFQQNFRVVQIYAAILASDGDEVEELYDELESILRFNYTVVTGYFYTFINLKAERKKAH